MSFGVHVPEKDQLRKKVTPNGVGKEHEAGGGRGGSGGGGGGAGRRPVASTRMASRDLLGGVIPLVRTLVSKKKRRIVEEGFNLDLSYITDRIIAMGFPADRLEALYRNDADEVVAFLYSRHGDKFYVYNLCRERGYDKSLFCGRVLEVPMRDHHPPALAKIKPFCEDADRWLAADSERVIVVHCKAGKGRTGVMVCCYLLHAGLADSPQRAMELFAQRRTSDGNGITIPSQRRYVDYYHRLLQAERAGRAYRAVSLTVQALRLHHVDGWPPQLEAELIVRRPNREERVLGCTPTVARLDGMTTQLSFGRSQGVRVEGDVMLVIWGRRRALLPRERLCRVWFNTWFVADLPRDASGRGTDKWFKKGLDLACRDDRISESACVQLMFLGEEAAERAGRTMTSPSDG